MSETFSVYCDESCHLERDRQKAMVLGAVWCPINARNKINNELRELKSQYGLSKTFETKWVKISPSKSDFYKSVVEYFFKNKDLCFRAVVVPDKRKLDHSLFDQQHDDFYYKMWFVLLKQILEPENRYRIYIDMKDTRGQAKVEKLHQVLCNAKYDFNRNLIEVVQQVRSHEIEILQVTDLFTGALSYLHRQLYTSSAKLEIIQLIQRLSGLSLERSTLPCAKKINVLIWNAQEW